MRACVQLASVHVCIINMHYLCNILGEQLVDGLVRFTVTIHVQGDDLNMFQLCTLGAGDERNNWWMVWSGSQ